MRAGLSWSSPPAGPLGGEGVRAAPGPSSAESPITAVGASLMPPPRPLAVSSSDGQRLSGKEGKEQEEEEEEEEEEVVNEE